jgi:Iron/manganese superoxide dismutases, C-terminal domain
MQAGTRNAIGGHYNHALFWTTLAPAAKSGSPSQALQKAIDDSFGSTDAMKEKFNAAAAGTISTTTSNAYSVLCSACQFISAWDCCKLCAVMLC